MNFGPLMRFVHRFAWRDLLDPGARRSTRVNAFSMTLVTALTLASVGLALGTTEIKRTELTNDPLTLCLMVGDPGIAERVNPALWERINTVLRQPATSDGYLACYPFHVRTDEWLRNGVIAGGDWQPISGRSVLPGDQVLKSRQPLLWGNPFASDDQDGVIVSKKMLETLGLPVSPPPSTIIMKLSGGQETIPILGMFETNLPNNQQFLITEAYHQKLKQRESGLYATEIQTGPVPTSWPSFSKMPDELQTKILNLFETYGIKDPPREVPTAKGKPRTWKLKSENYNEPPSQSNWLTLLDQILAVMDSKDGNFADPKQIQLVPLTPRDALAANSRPIGPGSEWEMIGCYFNRVDKLPIAASVIARETSLPVHKEVIDRLEGFDHASSKALLSCLIGAVVLLASSCANLRVIQELRSELKLGEIGMLKAMGMSGGLLSGVYLYEAALVWAVGTVLGLAIGFGLGTLLSWLFIASTPSEILVGFWCPWYIWLLPLITGPTFLVSAFWGIRRARLSPPIAILKSS